MDATKEEQILTLLMEMKQKLEEHDKRFDSLEQDISGMKKDISNIKGQQEENTSILRALEHRAEENSAKIEGLSVGMAREFGAVRAEIKEVKTDLVSVKENTDEIGTIKQMVMEHEFNFKKMKIS